MPSKSLQLSSADVLYMSMGVSMRAFVRKPPLK